MSSNRHRRDDYCGDLEHRDRYRDRRRSRSRSRTPERYHRRRRTPASRSRSRSRDRPSGRFYSSRGDKRPTARYTSSSRRQSMSRSRSKSRTRRNSRSNSPFSHSRPTNSISSNSNSRPAAKFERTSQRQATEAHSSRKESEPHEHDNKSYVDYTEYSVEDLPLPKREAIGAYYNLNTEEPIDKERIHREMEEKLRATLAKEGKVYPPPKPEPSHPVFANDGSFIEIFKKMQQAQQSVPTAGVGLIKPVITHAEASTSNAAAYVAAAAAGKPAPPPLIVGRRRGGKILKTGMVAKPKAQGEDTNDPKDFWTIYLREVNKYKNNACDSDGGTRPLVK